MERLALGLTQRDVATRVGVGVPHLSKVESGRENPSDHLLRNIAEVFELDADELLIAAGRLPESILESLAVDPARALAYLRAYRPVCPTCEGTKRVPAGDPEGVGCWDC